MPTLKKLKKNKLLLPLLVALLVLLLAGLLLQLWAPAPMRRFVERLRRGDAESASYLFTEGAGELFALAGENLAVASPTAIQLIAPSGTVLASQAVTMEQGALAASKKLAAFYDVGGSAVYILRPDGGSAVLETENAVLFADADDAGRLAVVTRYPDYRGRVTVYNAALTPLFAYDSGQSGYPLCVRLAGDRTLAVCCAGESGSVVRFFRLDREQELGSYVAENELIWDIGFLNDGTLAAITEDALLLLERDGTLRGRCGFSGKHAADYALDGEFACVVLHRNRSGDAGALITVNAKGETLGTLTIDRAVAGVSCAGKRLLVQYSDELTLYNAQLADDVSYQRAENVLRALLREDGSALLLSRYGANLIRFE